MKMLHTITGAVAYVAAGAVLFAVGALWAKRKCVAWLEAYADFIRGNEPGSEDAALAADMIEDIAAEMDAGAWGADISDRGV